MIKQLRIIILFILLGTGTCLTAQNNTVTPLFAGKIGYHQYFGNDILLKDVVSPSGGNGTYSISWEYRYTDSNEWSEITRLAQSDYEGGMLGFIPTFQYIQSGRSIYQKKGCKWYLGCIFFGY